jgi:hypothetical protein
MDLLEGASRSANGVRRAANQVYPHQNTNLENRSNPSDQVPVRRPKKFDPSWGASRVAAGRPLFDSADWYYGPRGSIDFQDFQRWSTVIGGDRWSTVVNGGQRW